MHTTSPSALAPSEAAHANSAATRLRSFLASPAGRRTLRALGLVVAAGSVVLLACAVAHAQDPSSKDLDQIITSSRNWLIVKGVTLIGACLLAWRVMSAMGGDREGFSNVAKVFALIVVGLAAVSIIAKLQSWVN